MPRWVVTRNEKADIGRTTHVRQNVPDPPNGRQRLRWYGPALLWVLSSVGSGSVLFTPRVGSRYGYALLWAALLVILTEFVIIREVGRYTVATGRTILDGFRELPGPRGWAVWLIFVPQLVAASVTIAGIAALAGSALMIALPGSQWVYATGMILLSIVLVVSGKYKGVERVSSVLAGVMIVAAVTAAVRIFPGPAEVAQGVLPQIPADFDLYFVLPWLGFILSGAAGVMWFSYWVAERGYGGAVHDESSVLIESNTSVEEEHGEALQRIDKLRDWLKILTTTALIAVGGGALVVVSFLTLGAEVLRPEGIVPEGIQVAEQLTNLFSEIWGIFGYWLLLVGIVIALWGTILADQDGWGRTFADATMLLHRSSSNRERQARTSADDYETAGNSRLSRLMRDRERLKNWYAVIFAAVIPLIIFWAVRDPVEILSVGGIIAATHTPFIVFLTHYVNRKHLPKALQPTRLDAVLMIGSGLFFLAFAVLYLLDIGGVQLL